VHEAVGKKFIKSERQSLEARVESREGILAWYLHRALNANAVMSMHVVSDEQLTGPAETTNSVRRLVQQVRSRVVGDGAGDQMFQHKNLDEKLRSIAGVDALRATNPSRAVPEGVPRTFAEAEDEV
jgi:hypothetical protein